MIVPRETLALYNIIRIAISLALTPLILLACPIVSGLTRDNFCVPSVDRLLIFGIIDVFRDNQVLLLLHFFSKFILLLNVPIIFDLNFNLFNNFLFLVIE